MSKSSSSHNRALFIVFAGIVTLYLCLVLPTVNRHGIAWDEQTDLFVAMTYTMKPYGWLIGSAIDAQNVRLPMATVALLFSLTGEANLAAARLVSCGISLLTLLAVFLFCRFELNARKGIVASLLLATSPYFLAYSKSAFTEGDAFITCAFSWLLLSLSRLRQQRNFGWGAVAAVSLGLALSSKISAVSALPVVFWILAFPAQDESPLAKTVRKKPWIFCLVLLALMFSTVFGGWELMKTLIKDPHFSNAYRGIQALVLLILWGAVLFLAGKHRKSQLGRWQLAFFVPILGSLTFFVLPPLHTTNPSVFRALVSAFLQSQSSPPSFVLEAAILHFSVVAIKASPVIGVCMWVSVGVGLFRLKSRPELRLPLLLLGSYLLFLLRLPWAQTFYMMPAFPLLAILLADMGVEAFDRHRRAALVLTAAALLILVGDLVRSYPDLHLNGFQWVGNRYWGGRTTVNPRGIVQIRPDGAELALRWVAEHAQPHETIVTVVRPRHIVKATISDSKYRLIDGLADPQAIERGDWVVTTLQAPYDRRFLRAHFSVEYTVKRAFGFEDAHVWRRKE